MRLLHCLEGSRTDYQAHGAMHHPSSLCLYSTSDRPRTCPVSAVQLVNLPADRIASTWRKYLDCFATCLLHWGGDPQSPSGRRMERLYWEAGLLWGSVQIKHPDRLAVSKPVHFCTKH